jgi:hypothetical protein
MRPIFDLYFVFIIFECIYFNQKRKQSLLNNFYLVKSQVLIAENVFSGLIRLGYYLIFFSQQSSVFFIY